jgi:hypothetical protein
MTGGMLMPESAGGKINMRDTSIKPPPRQGNACWAPIQAYLTANNLKERVQVFKLETQIKILTTLREAPLPC